MTATALAEIAQLSLSERIQLAEDIWDSVGAESELLSITQPQREELEQRLQSHRNDPHSGALWQEVAQRMQRSQTTLMVV